MSFDLDTTEKIERVQTGEIAVQSEEIELFLVQEAVTVETLSIPVIVMDSTPAVEVDIYAVRHPEFPAVPVAKSSRLQKKFPPVASTSHLVNSRPVGFETPPLSRTLAATARWGISLSSGAALAALGMLAAAWIAFQ